MRLVKQVHKYFFLFIAMGSILLLMGIFGFYFLLFGGVSDPELLVAAGSCFFAGIGILLKMVRPLPKKVPKNNLHICPFCGSIIEKNATFCTKCKRQLTK
ncbi:MAG: hypothetical protein AC479_06200 [miscellaneous Crenarchaeota group-6 archaeon AD8-1]|nr:MAG: hypothetical protein AC479_06200 [miscellaneous Crenarchaeota group-6 archaeon AD8-1]